jgi:hypothetical protein
MKSECRQAVDTQSIARLAAEAQLDPRTVRRAMENGIDSLRSGFDRERLQAAAKKLRIEIKK